MDAPAPGRLGERERSILEFEADWQDRAGGRHDGGKEEAIRARLGLTPPRYYQLLGRVIDTQAALAYDPVLVARLRRLQESRREQSRARLGGAQPGSDRR
ncbi:hypothetical protein LK09_06670 [Microbacterium mangrovi]|uniref:DUF3263 domain-containing protein n=1 Tax=Microbacterium mangrovi TaxID=1348253 RepID=A0A0B2ABP6_9MICO|nr:hypothetical protein LK09_06670 [Microbacterium mangrovi]